MFSESDRLVRMFARFIIGHPYVDGQIQNLLLHCSACHHENLVPMPLPLNHSNIQHCILFSLMDIADLCFRSEYRECCCNVGFPFLFVFVFYSVFSVFDGIVTLCSSLYFEILSFKHCSILKSCGIQSCRIPAMMILQPHHKILFSVNGHRHTPELESWL